MNKHQILLIGALISLIAILLYRRSILESFSESMNKSPYSSPILSLNLTSKTSLATLHDGGPSIFEYTDFSDLIVNSDGLDTTMSTRMLNVRGLRGPSIIVYNNINNNNAEIESSSYPMSGTVSYLLYIDTFTKMIELPVLTLIYDYKHYSIPRIKLDCGMRKIDCVSHLPVGLDSNYFRENTRNPVMYTYNEELKTFEDYQVNNGINIVGYRIVDKSFNKIDIFLNGIIVGTLTKKEEFLNDLSESSTGMELLGIPVGDMSVFSEDLSGNHLSNLSGSMDTIKVLIDSYLNKIKSGEKCEIYGRKMQLFSDALSNEDMRRIWETREIPITGPRPYKGANFALSKSLGDFVSDETDDIEFVEKGLKANMPLELNIDGNSGNSFSREYILSVEPGTGEAESISETEYSRSHLIYSLVEPSKSGVLKLKSHYDESKEMTLNPGVKYHICEVVNSNNVIIYINGEEFLDIVLQDDSESIKFKDPSKMYLISSGLSTRMSVIYDSVKYFKRLLTKTEVSLLVYDKLSGVDDFSEAETHNLKQLFRSLLRSYREMDKGEKEKTTKENKQNINKIFGKFDSEVDRLLTNHREEIIDKDRNINFQENELKKVKDTRENKKEKNVQIFLRENKKIDNKEWFMRRKIKKMEKYRKKFRRVNKILIILLIVLVVVFGLQVVWRLFGEKIVNLFNFDTTPVYDYSKRSRMSSYPGSSLTSKFS